MTRFARHLALWLVVLAAWSCLASSARADTFTVGSKRFTESYVLAEIVRATAERTGEATSLHKPGLGNTGIVFEALRSGAIDVYPEYTGTIAREVLGGKVNAGDLAAINRELAPMGLAASIPFGFNDTYALAAREDVAQKLHLGTVGDLAAHPELRLGLSQEFLERQDGWAALLDTYKLPHKQPRGLDHGLAYEALSHGELDVIDAYSTDAKIERYRLVILRDDQGAFPRYDAVLLHRADLPQRLPRTWEALRKLEGKITERTMIRMNADAELRAVPFEAIAAAFLDGKQPAAGALTGRSASFWSRLTGPDLARLASEHLLLVFASLTLGILVGVPLGIFASERPGGARLILGAVGLVQTIPSLALLAFLIPVFKRIGVVPALAALFLYSLLPIVQGAYTGMTGIPAPLKESAMALGLPRWPRLRLIELPLAARSIVAGVKTSAVINVGTATIAAFIGAGGFGERIASGLALNDHTMLLAGAIPAAALALVVESAFAQVEKRFVRV